MTEALGGFWQSVTQDDVKFVPLEQFMSDKFLDEWSEGDLDHTDLVLEGGE